MDRPLARKCLAALSATLFLPWLLLGTGCGGASTSAAGGDGSVSARVSVSLSSSPAYEGAGARTSSPSAAAREGGYDHAWITVYRVELLPADGGDRVPDPEGEGSVYDGEAAPPRSALAGELSPPATVDLLNLPGAGGALLLDSIPAVPPGSYRKLRLHYRDPKVQRSGAPDNVSLSPTAHYHLDLHFAGEGLVLPGGTGPSVRVAHLAVTFLRGGKGLKVVEDGARLHMRPQVFCSVAALEYGSAAVVVPPLPPSGDPPPAPEPPPPPVVVMTQGTAGWPDADGTAGSLVTPLGNPVRFAWDGATEWSWVDNETAPSRIVAVPGETGSASLQDGALATVFGTVSPDGSVRASSVTIAFPAKASGAVVPLDPFDLSLFLLSPAGLQVSPAPSLMDARYEDAYGNRDPLGFERVLPATRLTVRGYEFSGTVSAWWITFGG